MERVTAAGVTDAHELAEVAARTFPLACPPTATPDNIAAFIEANLSAARFSSYLNDPARAVLVAREKSRIIGYAMLIRALPDDDDVRRAVTALPTVELSKIYVLSASHGTGAAAGLMSAAIEYSVGHHARSLWLGVNQNNQRAQRFYAKHGFTIAGTKSFPMGAEIEDDYVMVRSL